MAEPNRRVNSRSLRRELRHIYEDGNAVRSLEDEPEKPVPQKKKKKSGTSANSGRASGKASSGGKKIRHKAARGKTSEEKKVRHRAAAGSRKRNEENVSRSRQKTSRKNSSNRVKMNAEENHQRKSRRRSVLEERRLRNNRVNARAVHAGTVLFITIACVISMFACVSYLRLRSRRVTQLSEIAAKQSQLSSLQSDNDAYYKEVTASESLSEIRKTALEKLGMKYPDESQIRYYNADDNSYVRQYTDVPDDE